MIRWTFILVAAVAAGWASAASVHAQTLEQQGYRPVDQFIEDIDPLGTTLRRESSGLLTIGERTNVYRRIQPGTDPSLNQREDRLYFISYGVVAEFDQSQYAIIEETGAILQFIPPDTVFHLGLPPNEDNAPRPLVPGQIDDRIDGRVTMELQPYSASQPPAEPLSAGQRYGILMLTQRALVQTALNRLASNK